MHAASVHPEPGSNSRMFVSNPFLRKGQILIRAWLLFTFCLSSISLRIFEFRSRTHTWISPCSMLVLSSCCSIFNDRFLPPFLWAAWLLYHTDFRLSSVFSKFFQSFFKNFFAFPPEVSLPILLHRFRFVNTFFEIFLDFCFLFGAGATGRINWCL